MKPSRAVYYSSVPASPARLSVLPLRLALHLGSAGHARRAEETCCFSRYSAASLQALPAHCGHPLAIGPRTGHQDPRAQVFIELRPGSLLLRFIVETVPGITRRQKDAAPASARGLGRPASRPRGAWTAQPPRGHLPAHRQGPATLTGRCRHSWPTCRSAPRERALVRVNRTWPEAITASRHVRPAPPSEQVSLTHPATADGRA